MVTSNFFTLLNGIYICLVVGHKIKNPRKYVLTVCTSLLLFCSICTIVVAPNPQIDMTDIYDTAVNPEPDDIYDEAMPGPVSSSVKIYSTMLIVLLTTVKSIKYG